MSVSDPIADTLTILRNAARARKETVEFPASKLLERMMVIFKNDGYIEDSRLLKDNKQGILKVYLKYENTKPVIIKRSEFRQPILPQNYSGLTKTLSAACASLSNEIAGELATLAAHP